MSWSKILFCLFVRWCLIHARAHFCIFFFLLQLLSKVCGKLLRPISVSWKQQSYDHTGRVKRWQVSTTAPLFATVALILSGTEESTSANAAPVSLWMDLRGDKCWDSTKMSSADNNARMFQNPILERDTERNISRERPIHHGRHLCIVACLTNTHFKNADSIKDCEFQTALTSVSYCQGTVTDA